MIEIESKFYEEVHELECKYAAKYEPLCDRVSLKRVNFSKRMICVCVWWCSKNMDI